MNRFPAIRDMLLFLGGLGGVFHETVLTHSERPTLLILFAAMMGLPAFLRADENKKDPPQPPYYPPLPPGQPPYPPYQSPEQDQSPEHIGDPPSKDQSNG